VTAQAIDSPLRAEMQEELARMAQRLPGGAVGGYSLPEDCRFVADRGEGPYIYDTEGKRYVDFVAGAGTLILGHCPRPVTRAIQSQAEKGTVFFGTVSEPVIALADELVRAIPCAEMVSFATTGSEATMYAMRLARAFTRRNGILKFEGAYHGNHDYAQVGTAPKAPSNYPSALPDTAGIVPGVVPSLYVAPFNDLEAVEAILRQHGRDIAAIIVEPIQRGILPQPGFLESLRELTQRHDLLLIFDEVVTGFRLAYGGAQEYFGVVPDLATFGKIIGGGLALGAVAGRRDVLLASNPADRGREGFVLVNGTQHGNPIASAAGLAMLDQLRKPGFYEKLNDMSATFREEVSAIVMHARLPAVVTGIASLWHVVFAQQAPVSHVDMMRSDMARLRAFDAELIRQGVLVLPGVRRINTATHDATALSLAAEGIARAASKVR